MKHILNTIRCSACIIRSVLLLPAVLLAPIPFAMSVIVSIPKTVFSQMKAHKNIMIVILLPAMYLCMVKFALSDMELPEAVTWLIRSGEWKTVRGLTIFGTAILFTILLRIFIALIEAFFRTVDDYVYMMLRFLLSLFFSSIKDIRHQFLLLAFGSMRKKELFDMHEFRKSYSISI